MSLMNSPEPDFFGWDLEAFVRTLFGPPTYADPSLDETDWSAWQAQFPLLSLPGDEYDPNLILRHAAVFCREAKHWMEPYSGEAFAKGCFWLFSEHGPIGDALYEHPGDKEAKLAFVSAIPNLYGQLASWHDEQVSMALFGLWDSLCYGFKSGRHAPLTDELLMIRETSKDALVRQLNSPESLTQDAALHGLNHLAHPDGTNIVLAWVDSHPDLDEPRKAYAW